MTADTKAWILELMRIAWIMVFLGGLLTDFYDFIVGVGVAVAIAIAKFILARIWRVPATESSTRPWRRDADSMGGLAVRQPREAAPVRRRGMLRRSGQSAWRWAIGSLSEHPRRI